MGNSCDCLSSTKDPGSSMKVRDPNTIAMTEGKSSGSKRRDRRGSSSALKKGMTSGRDSDRLRRRKRGSSPESQGSDNIC